VFVLKKIVGYLLMPLPLGLFFLVFGVIAFALHRKTVARWSFGAGLLVLLLASNRAISINLCSSLESRYPAMPASFSSVGGAAMLQADYVAVLGSGHGSAPGLPASQRLSPSARARLMAGLRLALLLPEARLIVSGPLMGSDKETHARALAEAAMELGFPRERIIEIDTARDTSEETIALAGLVGAKKVALVTSAWHLPRAMHFARAAGLDALPCPSDYLGRDGNDVPAIAWCTWDVDSLGNTTRTWREYIGMLWARIITPTPY